MQTEGRLCDGVVAIYQHQIKRVYFMLCCLLALTHFFLFDRRGKKALRLKACYSILMRIWIISWRHNGNCQNVVSLPWIGPKDCCIIFHEDDNKTMCDQTSPNFADFHDHVVLRFVMLHFDVEQNGLGQQLVPNPLQFLHILHFELTVIIIIRRAQDI